MTSSSIPTDAEVAMDRFVSASSAEDAQASLTSLIEFPDFQATWIWKHEDVAEHLVYLLQHGHLKSNNVEDSESVTLALKLYDQYLVHDKNSTRQPEPSRLLEALLDVMDRTTASTYTRALALQVLQKLSKHKDAMEQWLIAPNGIHRLAETLWKNLDNPMEEAVRTQALGVALVLAQASPAIAKIFLFVEEVETQLLEMTWQVYGGLTKGNPMVADILVFIKTLVQQTDKDLHDLVWQRPAVVPRLTQLLDLRGGDQYLHPEQYEGKRLVKAAEASKQKKPAATKPKLGPLSSRNLDDDEEDDLDNLLQSATKKKKKPQDATAVEKDDAQSPLPSAEIEDKRPRLLEEEEVLVSLVLDILDLLLQDEGLRRTVWSTYAPGLCVFIWQTAFLTPPPPTVKPFCAFPSSKLQQKAIRLAATKLANAEFMDKSWGLDGVLTLVCTGGGFATTLEDKLGTSQAALAALRSVLDTSRIHELLLHTLAPPPMEEGAPPPSVPVVQKLWNTVAENLVTPEETAPTLLLDDQRTIFVSGALGGLSVFLADEESREMLFKATPPPASLDHMLEVLVEDATKDELDQHQSIRLWSLGRFLCEYIWETPRLVHTLLSSSASTHLAKLATMSNPNLKPLIYLLLGLCLEFFPTTSTECGGWTPASISELLLQTVGISKVTKALEGLKKHMPKDGLLPWSVCELETERWQKWYEQAVSTVRKRMVREMTGSSMNDGDESDEGETTSTSLVTGDSGHAASSAKIKPLRRMIEQQATELEELRAQLEKAESRLQAQDHQLETWQRRMKSTPTELDSMLNELTTKSAALEEEILSLKNDAKRSQERHSEQLAVLTKNLDESREDATKARSSEQEAKDERDRMEQELQAVSQAYANLEEEYRRSSATTAGGAPTGESASSSQQAQGEASTPSAPFSPGGSTEVSTLRAENERLRQDARAADEWMAMAVNNMNAMGAHTGQLQQEITSLKAQLEAAHQSMAAGASHQEQALRQEIDRLAQQEQGVRHEMEQATSQLRELVSSLESQVQEGHNEAKSLREQLQVAEGQKAVDIQLAVSASEEKWRKAYDQLEQEKVVLEQRLQQTQAAASTIGSPAPSSVDDSNQSLQILQLKSELESKASQIISLQAALDEARKSPPAPYSPSPLSQVASDDAVNQQLEAARKEIEEVRHRGQEDIYKKEAIIRELEDRLGSGLGPYKVEDIRERDEEIEELRIANEAAQEWMAKAVEHHQLLQEQVAALTEEKATLATQLQQGFSLNVNDAAVKLLEGELKEKNTQLEHLSTQLSKREAELNSLREDFEASQSMQENMGIAREDVQVLQKQLEEAHARVAELESKMDGNALYEENEKLSAANSDLEYRLQEFQSWTDLAQSKIAELLAAKEQADKVLSEFREQLQAKDLEISTIKAQVGKAEPPALPAETEADRSVIEQLQSEMQALKAANVDLSNERNTLSTKYTELESDYKALQSWTEGAQQRIFEVVTAKERLESELQELRSQLSMASQSKEAEGSSDASLPMPGTFEDSDENLGVSLSKDDKAFFGGNDREVDTEIRVQELEQELQRKDEELRAALETLDNDADVVQQWTDRVAELEAIIASLQTQSQEQEAEANDAITEWQESYADISKKCVELEDEVKRLKEQIPEAVLTKSDHAASNLTPSDEHKVLNASPSDAAAFFGGDPGDTTMSVAESNEKLCGAEEDARATEDALGDEDQEVQRLRQELQAANEALDSGNDVIRQWEDRVTELEGTILSLTTQIEEEQNEANQVISQWQESYNAADQRCTELEQQIAELRADNPGAQRDERSIQLLQSQLEEKEEEIAQMKKQLAVESMPATAASHSGSDDAFAFFGDHSQDPQNHVDKVGERPEASKSVPLDDSASVQHLERKVSELELVISTLQSQMQDQQANSDLMISQLQESKTEVEGKLSSLSLELESIRQEKVALEEQKQAFESSHATSESSPTSSQGAMAELLLAKEQELQDANETLAEAEEAVKQWALRSDELEAEISTLNAQIDELRRQSETYHGRCDQLEAEVIAERGGKLSAEKQGESLSSKAGQLEVELEGVRSALEKAQSQLADLEEQNSLLQSTLNSNNATTPELTSTLQERDREIASLKETLLMDEQVIQQWEDRVQLLEESIAQLQNQLEEHEKEANMAIEQWQQTYSDLDVKFNATEAELAKNAEKLADRDWTVEQLQAEVREYRNQLDSVRGTSADKEQLEEELAVERGRHKEAREEVETLSKSLEATKNELSEFRIESEVVIGQWTDRVEELESKISLLEAQLSEQESDANEAISSWEAKADELERELDVVSEKLKNTTAELDARNGEAEKLEREISELSENLESLKSTVETLEDERRQSVDSLSSIEEQLTNLQTRCDELQATEEVMGRELQDTLKELQEVKAERDRVKEIQASKSREKLEDERDRLTVVIAQLEEELNEANNMVQAHITDGASDRAAEAAGQALRDEIDELRMQMRELRSVADEERYKRETAEHEIERLRDDIAALVSLNEHECTGDEIQQRTAKAVERLKMKERIEIDQLRKSLYRSIEEVEAARAAEKEANEHLAKIRLQTAVGEQEIIAAKSEINFLTQALEELRMNEESKRASLEYRIGSLEDENDVLRRYHSSELETVRNELAQVGMEKDRILHQLKESQKTNSALVIAASKAETIESFDGSDFEAEVSKLRIENAHLLTVAADDKARAERRLREVLAAHRATAEADTILEHELRLAAEATIQSLKAQLEELRHTERRDGGIRDDGHRAATQQRVEKLAAELDGLRNELQKAKKENSSLKAKMEQAASKAKAEILSLTEECRQAQAKAHKYEREGRFDAAVMSEVAKLRAAPDVRETPNGEWRLVTNNENDDPAMERAEAPLVGAETYDLIRRQKEEMQEERKMYLEVLEEHEDLLALLAQHDLERECLKEALSKAAGVDAVEEVLRSAEEKALAQFGNIIRVA